MEISVFLDPQRRGSGLGSSLIASAVRFIARSNPWSCQRIIARIKAENQASQSAFRRAGFHLEHEVLAYNLGDNCEQSR